MSGLIESATAILGASRKRLEVTAQNVANVSTPGYKREVAFAQILAAGNVNGGTAIDVSRDFGQGTLTATSNPLDLAISGAGFFQLRTPNGTLYSRQGQFRFAADGTLVTPQGYVLQQAGGGDLVLTHAAVSIAADGTVTDNGSPVGRVGLFAPSSLAALNPVGDAHFTAPDGTMTAANGSIRQGMTENSNVSTGDEMVAMTASVRQSETGARLVQVYDDLMGRVMTTFGSGR